MMYKNWLIIIVTCILGIRCHKESLIYDKIPKKIDSLCVYKEYQSKKLFIVQFQKKNDNDYIRISTSEFFDKDSAKVILEHNDKIVVYYNSSFLHIQKGDIEKNISKYSDFVFDSNNISIFRHQYLIFRLTKNQKLINTKNGIEKDLFQYGYMQDENEIN